MLFLLVFSTQAQNTVSSNEKPDLVIIEKEWHIEFRNPVLDEDPFRANNELRQILNDRRENDRQNAIRTRRGQPLEPPPTTASRIEPRRVDPWTRYIYQLKIKNTGGKEIKIITWDYVFFEPGTQNEIGRRTFTNKADISPNKTKSLVVRSSTPPSQTINAGDARSKLRDQYSEKVIISAIEYKDGSTWKAILPSN